MCSPNYKPTISQTRTPIFLGSETKQHRPYLLENCAKLPQNQIPRGFTGRKIHDAPWNISSLEDMWTDIRRWGRSLKMQISKSSDYKAAIISSSNSNRAKTLVFSSVKWLKGNSSFLQNPLFFQWFLHSYSFCTFLIAPRVTTFHFSNKLMRFSKGFLYHMLLSYSKISSASWFEILNYS